MYKLENSIMFLIFMFFVSSCNQLEDGKVDYENQIGDTPFNKDLDDASFKFCDSTNVLHKRALIHYKGGSKALEEALIDRYNRKPSYQSFSGYFIIRFAVNCNEEAGRFRIQTLDSNFNPTDYPEDLEEQILSIVSGLKDWSLAFYKGENYDSYSFINIKMINGQIEKV